MSRHPADVLFRGEKSLPMLPAVDHYCGSEKLMRKAMELQRGMGPVFDITLDCEDGAPVGHEAGHAQLCAELITSGDNAHDRIGARIHDITHPCWEADLEALIGGAGRRLAFLTLPKVRSAADAKAQIDALRDAERRHQTGREVPVHVLIETHGALRGVWEIAALHGVESIDFGLMDFVSEHRGAIPGSAMRSPGQFEHPLVMRAKAEISAAALAHGVMPTHNVTTELKDTALMEDDARRARQLFGYLRMWSIHPLQIAPILAAMRPASDEVQIAGDILCAAQDADWGPIRHDGKLHDRASYRYYWDVIARARNTGCEITSEAAQRFFAT